MKTLFLTTFLLTLATFHIAAQQVQYLIPPGDSITSIAPFSEGMAKVEVSFDKKGFVDTTGKLVIGPMYEDAGSFHDGLASVARTINDTMLFGFMDKKGTLVIPFQFEQVKDFSCSRSAVKKDGAWQYIDKSGKAILNDSFILHDSTVDPDEINPRQFQNGLLSVKKNGKCGYVDTSGNWKIQPVFIYAKDFSDGVAIAGVNDGPSSDYIQDVIDTGGHIVLKLGVDGVGDFADGMASFENEGTSYLWGFINKTGDTVFAPQFANKPYDFSEGLSIVQVDGKEDGNKDGFLLTLDTTGKVVSRISLCTDAGCIYDSKYGFHDGLLAVKIENKWGYMDKTGKIVIPPQFDEAYDFQEGFATVKTLAGQVAVIKSPL